MKWLAVAEFDATGHDVYYDPAYLRSVAGDAEIRVLVAKHLVLPVLVKSIPGTDLFDAESPYGYAAPVVSGPVAWADVAQVLRDNGIINAFVRGHPLQPWCGLVERTTAATAVIPLAPRELAFSGARCANHRSQVKRARGLGFVATCEPAPQQLATFRALYERTMERLAAASFYRFGDAAWASLAALGERLAVITVQDAAGVVHNQALFMRGPRCAHYHLSARSDDAHNAAGNLLFEAAAEWASAHGCDNLHLGGGTSGAPDDSLLRYKQRIGRIDAIFRTAGLICDPQQHAALIAEWQLRTGRQPAWFQAYRQPG